MDTIILRFRDLRTAPGGTLSAHAQTIQENGFTWWGWWRRPYEGLATDFLWQISDRCPLTILLLDTGSLGDAFRLHRAVLDGIEITPTGSDIPSPDVAATPSYYNDLRLSAWFKLSQIKLPPETGITSIRLLDLPTWPDKNDPELTTYRNMIVTSQVQLRRFDVTLWHAEIELQA
jgi:hypothetical protein